MDTERHRHAAQAAALDRARTPPPDAGPVTRLIVEALPASRAAGKTNPRVQLAHVEDDPAAKFPVAVLGNEQTTGSAERLARFFQGRWWVQNAYGTRPPDDLLLTIEYLAVIRDVVQDDIGEVPVESFTSCRMRATVHMLRPLGSSSWTAESGMYTPGSGAYSHIFSYYNGSYYESTGGVLPIGHAGSNPIPEAAGTLPPAPPWLLQHTRTFAFGVGSYVGGLPGAPDPFPFLTDYSAPDPYHSASYNKSAPYTHQLFTLTPDGGGYVFDHRITRRVLFGTQPVRYEVRYRPTVVLGEGEFALEFPSPPESVRVFDAISPTGTDDPRVPQMTVTAGATKDWVAGADGPTGESSARSAAPAFGIYSFAIEEP